MLITKQKPDNLGAIASSLCLVHCIATPFLFVVQTGVSTCCDAAPSWWKMLDYFFLVISFVAIYWSTKTSSIKWMKPLLWINWFILLAIILNEKLEIMALPEASIYLPAFALIVLHLYNRKHCRCNKNSCCVDGK